MCSKHSYMIKGLVTAEKGPEAAENRIRESSKFKNNIYNKILNL